jgi:mycofactocin precursor
MQAPTTPTPTPVDAPAGEDGTPGDDELVLADVLVEEISIDGMCGVY